VSHHDDPPGVFGDVVTWWGHATTTIDMGGYRFMTDPLLGAGVGPLRWSPGHQAAPLDRPVTAVLVSHLHRDHLDLPSLARLPPQTPVLVPAAAGKYVRGLRRHRTVEVSAGDAVTFGRVTVTALPADHDGRRSRRGPAAPALGYVVRAGARSVWFAGDTGPRTHLAPLQGKPIGVAIVPVGGWGLTLGRDHLDPRDAARILARLEVATAVPIHWGSLRIPVLWRLRRRWFLESAEAFTRECATIAPHVEVPAAGQGTRVPIPTASP
jgi:L-ascorbate metabolism protein UlaG (beta-lactamase superfamily)